ncbi:hypothetical protein BOTCAL_0028g00080 [Botryotinia calthae]|uniref:Uncharacterized protein n=1 Tax=Botryotinia calthae TaxID=38488 RepID=A0A4Y8DDP2_9HELO|nr:hypothetical protein BOTCAL_0028g00080 [Botryotinia calthae]
MPIQNSNVVHDPKNFIWTVASLHNPYWSLLAELSFCPCYRSFECACLEVPLDWNNSSTDSRCVAVALIKLPSDVHASGPRYGGSVIINPGGPGGSGINLARNQAGAEGMLGSSSAAFKLMWARKHAHADACYTRMGVDENEEDALGAHISTPVIVMDMKAIMKALSKPRVKSPSRDRECTKSSQIESVYKIQY